MQQEQLFIETEEQAVEHLAARIGGLKALAMSMYPELPPGAAHKNLLNKLNPQHAAVWSSTDRAKANRVGAHNNCHILKWFCDDNEGYQRSQPAEPTDPDDELADRIESATAVLAKALEIYSRRHPKSEGHD